MQQLNRPIRLLLGKGLIPGLLVALTGMLLASSNLGRWLEEDVGLSWLFQLRGPLPVPAEVVVVSINHLSSQKLGLADSPRKWPRSVHGELIRKLKNHGAAVIVFDIFFEEIRDQEENRLFSQALRESGNSILFQSLNKEPINTGVPESQTVQTGYIQSLISPTPVLRDAAFGLAPFPLPKVPAQVNHFITFKPELGDLPTLPVVALQVYALPVYTILRDHLNEMIPEQITRLPATREQLNALGGIQKLSQSLRQLFLNNPKLGQQLTRRVKNSTTITPAQRKLLSALISSYSQPHSQYLNFYGPSHTLTTIPYFKVLESADHGDPLGLAGKAIFVGFSDEFQAKQQDGFYTVFSQPQSGLDVSGVEIAATGFSNLLEGRTLKVTSATTDILIYLLWATLLCLVLFSLNGPLLVPATLLLCLAYHQLGYELFRQMNYSIPLAIPLLWQAPLALMGALLWNYLNAHRERHNIRHAFGQHLPIEIVDQLTRGKAPIGATGQPVNGVVLASDAQQYASLSERLNPLELRELLNHYYATLFAPIRNSGGIISDVVGDAALAIWTTSSALPGLSQRQHACHAALHMLSDIENFNHQHPACTLPTRLGLHYGELVMGHVGAMDHYEYRAVGDTVNTASRIEGLNKKLGTRILVSKEMLQGVEGFITRELGNFLLAGKSKPLNLYELIAKDDKSQSFKPYDDFVRALNTFLSQQWSEAASGFENFILQYGEDGPSRYYLNLCHLHQTSPPSQWDGIIRVTTK